MHLVRRLGQVADSDRICSDRVRYRMMSRTVSMLGPQLQHYWVLAYWGDWVQRPMSIPPIQDYDCVSI